MASSGRSGRVTASIQRHACHRDTISRGHAALSTAGPGGREMADPVRNNLSNRFRNDVDGAKMSISAPQFRRNRRNSSSEIDMLATSTSFKRFESIKYFIVVSNLCIVSTSFRQISSQWVESYLTCRERVYVYFRPVHSGMGGWEVAGAVVDRSQPGGADFQSIS